MTATLESPTASDSASAQALPEFLTRKYVVLHSGVGPIWKKGDVVEGKRFFSDERHRVQRFKKVWDKVHGTFVHVVEEEREVNELESQAEINRLLTVKAIREATPFESTLEHVELEKPVDHHLKGSNEEKLAKQEQEIAELRRQLAQIQQTTAMARAMTESRPVVQPPPVSPSAHTGDRGPTGVEIQPPPGGRSSPRGNK
jgi:hypothetical protein